MESLSDSHLRNLLEASLAVAAEGQNGFSGNCADVAVALNEAVGGDGTYVVVVGEHYEYVDHVFFRWKGELWDMDGPCSEEEAEQQWCTDGETLEDFEGDGVLAAVDNNGIFAGGFDGARFKRVLAAELERRGFAMPEADVPARKPASPFSRRP